MEQNDHGDHWSIPSEIDFDGNWTAKAIENQQLGFQIAGEVRRLRDELGREKQQRRILLVTNQSLEERCHEIEGRNLNLEQALRIVDDQRKQLQRSLDEEKVRNASISEELRVAQTKLKVDRDTVLEQQEQLSSFKSKIQQLEREVNRLQDYSRALELSVNELGQQMRVAEHRKAEIHHESTLLTEGLEILLQRLRILTKEERTTVPVMNVSSADRLQELQRLISSIFAQKERQEQKLQKEKAHVKQLLRVISLYESMMPLADDIEDQGRIKTRVNSRRREARSSSSEIEDD